MWGLGGFRLVGDEVIEGLVVLAGDWVGEGPAGDGGRGTPYLGHGLRRPNFVPKFGASVRVVVPYGWVRRAPSTTLASRRIVERLRRRG